MSSDDRLSRRHMLGLVGAGAAGLVTGGWVTWRLNRADVAAGSTGRPPLSTIPTSSSTTTSSTTSTTSTTEAASDVEASTGTTVEQQPPQFHPYATVGGEVERDAKLVACGALEALMLYEAGEDPSAVLDRAMHLAAPGLRAGHLERAAETLVIPDATSVPRVIYPQLGGLHPHLDPTTASVMVVVSQRLLVSGATREVSRCADVRVRKVDGEWRLEGIEDTSGHPVVAPAQLGDEALRVLEHPHVDMPDSVRWDIHDGAVDARILQEIADLADQTPVAVTTCMRGHPVNVFGRPDRSAHSVGRAVDIWALGDLPVVQQRDDTSSVAHQVTEDLFHKGTVHRLGAPWAFDAVGGRSWTDPVHKDHLHLGVSA